jgi:hypothetical protein
MSETVALADRLRAKYPSRQVTPERTGSIKVVANDVECFTWQGTYQDAVALQRRWLDESFQIYTNSTESSAKRAAGCLMAYGMPKPGDVDMRPSHASQRWTAEEIEIYKRAVLWLALHEHVPSEPGKKLEDVFVGKQVVVWFNGDRDELLAQTKAETESGADLSDCNRPSITGADEFQMVVGVEGSIRRDWPDAYTMSAKEFFALAGKPVPPHMAGGVIYMPLWPETRDHVNQLLEVNGVAVFVDATDSIDINDPVGSTLKVCVGFTNRELQQGRPAVIVGPEEAA